MLNDWVVKGVRKSNEYAMMGRDASDMSGKIGEGGKLSCRGD